MGKQTKHNKVRITSITVRANRAYGPFQHIRAEVTGSIEKGGDVKAAREELLNELHRVIHGASELLTSPNPPVADDDDLDYTSASTHEEDSIPEPF